MFRGQHTRVIRPNTTGKEHAGEIHSKWKTELAPTVTLLGVISNIFKTEQSLPR